MTQPVGAVGVTVPVNPTIATTDNTQLSSKAFLQLLVAQLQYQDPSKPVDTSSFMNETATLTQVQAMESSAQNSTAMLSAQRAQTASGLVGHTVTYQSADGTEKTGFVNSATISAAEPVLNIGTSQVLLSQVHQVLATATTAPAPDTVTPPADTA